MLSERFHALFNVDVRCIAGLLVPINYGGQWKKRSDGCWTYDAVSTRYVRVNGSTTYNELLDKICYESDISKDDYVIDVKAWISYPVNTVMPPYGIMRTPDIAIFIELNEKRDSIIPLCISTSPKTMKVVGTNPPEGEKTNGGAGAEEDTHAVKQMKKKSSIDQVCIQDNREVCSTIGIEDIKLNNPIENFGCNDEDYYVDEDEVKEDDSCGDDNHDPFNYACDEDYYERPDPFASVYDRQVDPYFGVCVEPLQSVQPEEVDQDFGVCVEPLNAVQP